MMLADELTKTSQDHDISRRDCAELQALYKGSGEEPKEEEAREMLEGSNGLWNKADGSGW